MIVSFNSDVFNSQDTIIQYSIAEIFTELMRNNSHFLELQSISGIFFNAKAAYIFDSTPISKLYFSEKLKKQIKEYITKKNYETITVIHRTHLTKITIGLLDTGNEVHPVEALQIIKERSKVIVENGINDWNFITGLCQKYTSHKVRKSIYKLICNAIKNEFLESDSGGGIGEIPKQVDKWMNSQRYSHIYKYKLLAIFDSDKNAGNNYVTTHISTIGFFKNKIITVPIPKDYEYESTDKIPWHILYKRKLENYVPIEILIKEVNMTVAQQTFLRAMIPADLDFIQYNLANTGLSDKRIKERFPEMFLSNFSFTELENRCSHHMIFSIETNENISEAEQILLKIAKII